MATTSRAPEAVAALLAILRAAPALSDVTIVDGPTATNFSGKRRLCVGWSPSGDGAVDIEQTFNSAGARTRDESFTIRCYAEARAGDTDMSLRRETVFDMVAVVEQALRATDVAPEAPTLNGTVLWAHLTTGNLAQEQTGDGALAGLSFTVSCRARI
jgi:hypothetical protein